MTTQKERFWLALQRCLKARVDLTVTDNAHVFLKARLQKHCWKIRLHWMFLKAPAQRELPKHLARYIVWRNRESSKIIDQYIEDHWHWVRHPMPPLRTAGHCYDLRRMFDDLNQRFLDGAVTAQITWGPKQGRRAYEQMQMGSYSSSRNLITIHPALDRKAIPQYVVEATVFHEMCHALVPVRKVNGRRQIHPPEFKTLERRYPRWQEAQRWEERHLGRLLHVRGS